MTNHFHSFPFFFWCTSTSFGSHVLAYSLYFGLMHCCHAVQLVIFITAVVSSRYCKSHEYRFDQDNQSQIELSALLARLMSVRGLRARASVLSRASIFSLSASSPLPTRFPRTHLPPSALSFKAESKDDPLFALPLSSFHLVANFAASLASRTLTPGIGYASTHLF